MPQREFWTHQHAVRLTITFHEARTTNDKGRWASIQIHDQAGATMIAGGGSTPPGFDMWGLADATRAAYEAWELGTAQDVVKAFERCLADWRKHANQITQHR